MELDEAEVIRRYEEKKRLLEGSGEEREGKEIFREAFRETVRHQPQAPIPDAKPLVIKKADDDASDQAVKILVDIALRRGIMSAVKKAAAESPYLVDSLHDALSDHYFDKLVASGKIRAL